MTNSEREHEPQQPTVIEKINASLQELGSSTKWKRAPEFKEEYESLRGKKVLMVDDVENVLVSFIPDLMVATDGEASFIKYNEQDVKELAQQIIEQNPDIVLLDYHLSDNLKGAVVAACLNDKGFEGGIIGFSSDSGVQNEFAKAGSLGCIDKNAGEPNLSVEELCKIVE